MDASAHQDHLRSDTAAVAAACRLGTDPPVEGCPGWDVGALVEHLGRIHRWVVRSFAADPSDRVPYVDPSDPAPSGDVAGWYDERAAELLATFAAADHAGTVATFIGPQPVPWWIRRQAHETAVHRWDAQRAHGHPEPIDAELASDAVDEYLSVFLPRWKG